MKPARVFGLALLVVLCATPAALSQVLTQGPSPESTAPPPAGEDAEDAQDLYAESCASCHGPDGRGTDYGPSLEQAGAAAADFYLRTGRMPLPDPDSQTVRKPPAFSEAEIALLVDYVATLGEGPAIPSLDPAAGDLSEGQEVYTENCAACHGAAGNGGAAGAGALAPSLHAAAPLDVTEATLIGPGEMPKFAFDERQRNSIVAYVEFLQTADPPGGADIGGVGPVPEGFVAWVVGIGILTTACYFIGTKAMGDGGK
jgi:ubiquinol-cytochrome c reductase cytochrome c subunit